MRKKILLFIGKLFAINFIFECDYKLRNLKFSPYQKVYCSITHEVYDSFVGCGIIVDWNHLGKSYWSFSNKLSDWYLVKMYNDKYLVLPEERITDLKTSIDELDNLLRIWDEVGVKPGDKGFPIGYKETAKYEQDKKAAFLNN